MIDKLKAFSLHLLCSAIIASCIVIFIFFFWYPAPLAKAVGASKIFMIVLAVDVVLGPILTFIVYKKGKKTLLFDMSVIFLIQLSALIYGLTVIYKGKPAWIVFNVDRFDAVSMSEVDLRNIDKAQEEFKQPNFFSPKWAFAYTPKDPETRNTIVYESVFAGVDIYQRPELFKPIEFAYGDMIKRSKNLVELEKYNKKKDVDTILQKFPDADGFLPLKANAVDMTVLINKKAGGKVVAIVDLRPWK